jgi:ribonuclease P protein component
MLKKTQRIPRGQFDALYKVGTRLHSPLCQLVYQAASSPAFSVVVGKKVAKQAVTRNRLRRRVYGVVERSLVPLELHIAGIILLKPHAKTATRLQLQADVVSLLARIPKSR